MDGPSLSRRIRAAQALGGYESVEQLAAAIDSPGLSAKTLRRIVNEKDPRQARAHELREIARACEVSYEFFTEPIAQAGDGHPDDVLGAVHDVERIVLEQSNRVADLKIEVLARIYERLETIDQHLTRLGGLPGRVENLEKTLEPIVELAVMRAASDFAAAAEQQEPGEAPGASQDTGRRRPGRGAADQ